MLEGYFYRIGLLQRIGYGIYSSGTRVNRCRETKSADGAAGVIMLLILGTLTLLAGFWSHPYAIYIAFALVVFAVALPQFGQGPKYEELLALLQQKAAQQND